MENIKNGSEGAKTNDSNPNSVVVVTENEVETNLSPSTQQQQQQQQSSRTPFTSLSQIDADLALARTLQEQERAYLMLRMNGHVSDYGSSENGSYDYEDDEVDVDEDEDDDDDDEDDDEVLTHDVDSEDGVDEEDAFDVHAHAEGEDNDQAAEPESPTFEDDEAYARYLQEAEEREMAIRLMAFAGLNDFQGQPDEDEEDHDSDDESQQDWEEVDPDELSYEELIALGEVVGTESRGLSIDTIAALPSVSYKAQEQDGGTEQCVICRLEFDDGETLTALSCKHAYHPECINNWLQINKVCPVCSTEVSTSQSTSS